MAVNQLGRVALGLAGDGLNAQLVNLPGGLGGQSWTRKRSFSKKTAQKGKFSYMLSTRGMPTTPRSALSQGEGLVVEHPVVFVVKEVGNLFSCSSPVPRPRSQRLPEIKRRPLPNWLTVRTQWLLQPLHRAMEVVYFKEIILSKGSMEVGCSPPM